MTDGYFKYFDGVPYDIITDEMPILTVLQAFLGANTALYYVKELPTGSEIIPSNMESEPASVICYYYDSDDEYEDVYLYVGDEESGTWVSFSTVFGGTFGGCIENAESAVDPDLYYVLMSEPGLQQMIPESMAGSAAASSVTSEEQTVTPTEETQVVTPVESMYLSQVTVNPIPNNYTTVSGELTINNPGVKHVETYKTVNVKLPSTYFVNSVDDLPADAESGSIAFVIGGE
jgi:hypothetical protein